MKNFLYILMFFIFFVQGYGQEKCRYPFDQSADSLINFVIAESGSKGIIGKWSGRRHEYKAIGHEEAFKECIRDLRSRIGDSLICLNVEMNSLYSFDKATSFRNVYILKFLYTIPVINEPIYITYIYNSDIDGKSKVLEYPRNLPTLSLSEINIKKEQVIEILKSKNILKEDDDFSMNVIGNYWQVTLTSDHFNYIDVSVNINTGELSNFRYRDILD